MPPKARLVSRLEHGTLLRRVLGAPGTEPTSQRRLLGVSPHRVREWR